MCNKRAASGSVEEAETSYGGTPHISKRRRCCSSQLIAERLQGDIIAMRKELENCVDRQEAAEAQIYALQRDGGHIWRALEEYVDNERARIYAREQSVEI